MKRIIVFAVATLFVVAVSTPTSHGESSAPEKPSISGVSAELRVFECIRNGDARGLNESIVGDFNARDGHGRTPLMVAVIHGQIEIMKLLLEKGMDLQATDMAGRTARDLARDSKNTAAVTLLESALQARDPDAALRAAIKAENIAGVQAALDAGADVNAKGKNYITPLMLAARRGVSIFKLLLDREACPNAVDVRGESIYEMIQFSGDGDQKKMLLEAHGGNQDARSINERLRTAVERNDADMVAATLKNQADPNHFGGTVSVLMMAAQYGHTEIARLLLSGGANPNTRMVMGDYEEHLGKTALFFAAANGRAETVKVLLFNKANPNLSTASGFTALMAAVRSKGTPEVVKLLLDAGANVNATRQDGGTALNDAIVSGAQPEIVKVLIAGGATGKSTGGDNPFIAAGTAGQADVVKQLLGASTPNEPEKNLALLAACAVGHTEVVKMLIENGADVNAADFSGRSAVALAASSGNEAAVVMLVKAGATNVPVGFDPNTGEASPPADSKLMTRIAWRDLVSPYDASSRQFTRRFLTEAAFKKRFGIPHKTSDWAKKSIGIINVRTVCCRLSLTQASIKSEW